MTVKVKGKPICVCCYRRDCKCIKTFASVLRYSRAGSISGLELVRVTKALVGSQLALDVSRFGRNLLRSLPFGRPNGRAE